MHLTSIEECTRRHSLRLSCDERRFSESMQNAPFTSSYPSVGQHSRTRLRQNAEKYVARKQALWSVSTLRFSSHALVTPVVVGNAPRARLSRSQPRSSLAAARPRFSKIPSFFHALIESSATPPSRAARHSLANENTSGSDQNFSSGVNLLEAVGRHGAQTSTITRRNGASRTLIRVVFTLTAVPLLSTSDVVSPSASRTRM
mmetsp:Transcript_1663/g.4960  ORF Transcript_1663/g.4960 Transcript_1663/m.4960 type:complete len:202 (+) Transcript_1663:346-951(+)